MCRAGLFCNFALGLDVEIDWFHEEILRLFRINEPQAVLLYKGLGVIIFEHHNLDESVIVAWSFFSFCLSYGTDDNVVACTLNFLKRLAVACSNPFAEVCFAAEAGRFLSYAESGVVEFSLDFAECIESLDLLKVGFCFLEIDEYIVNSCKSSG